MSDAFEASQASWRRLDDEWNSARAAWKDNTTQHFESHFWTPLENETRAYEHALERLIEALRTARSIATD